LASEYYKKRGINEHESIENKLISFTKILKYRVEFKENDYKSPEKVGKIRTFEEKLNQLRNN